VRVRPPAPGAGVAQQRDRWSHGDLLRLAHPKAPSRDHEAVFRWILSGGDGLGERTVTRRVKGELRVTKYGGVGELPELLIVFEHVKKASSKAEVVKLITEYELPREAILTLWLDALDVWDALLQRMPMTAMIRNLGKMTSLGLVQPLSDAAKSVVVGMTNNLKHSKHMNVGTTYTGREMFGQRLSLTDAKALLSGLPLEEVLGFCALLNAVSEVSVDKVGGWRSEGGANLMNRLLVDLLHPVHHQKAWGLFNSPGAFAPLLPTAVDAVAILACKWCNADSKFSLNSVRTTNGFRRTRRLFPTFTLRWKTMGVRNPLSATSCSCEVTLVTCLK
jgi:hypothetical protein